MRNIENILKTRIERNKARTFVIIVPTDSARLKRQRELVEYHPAKAVANLQVYDIENFVQQLYKQVHPPRQHIPQGLQNLWLQDIVNPQSDTKEASPYGSFRPNPDVPISESTLSLVAETINRFRTDTLNSLKERGKTLRDIAADTPTKADFVDIKADFVDIYENYEAKLGDHWIDDQGKHLHLANNFKSEFLRNAFPQVDLVVVEGFTLLSKADIKILTEIAGIPNIEMWFRTDYVEGNEALYKNMADLVEQFKGAGAHIDESYERTTQLHEHFAKNLFRTKAADHKCDPAVQINRLEPPNRAEEVEQIAHLIQKHMAAGDCKLSDICVTYYNRGQYEQRIAETFPAYGIPYLLVEAIPLTKSEVVKAIFSRLSARQVPSDDPYFSAVEPASHTRLFDPDAFQRYVDDLLRKGEVLQGILNPMLRKNREIVEGEMEAYRQFNSIVRELCSVLKWEGVESCAHGDYVKKLHYIAKHTNYQNSASTKEETVKIVPLGELRSLEFDVIFLGDFVEGGFPANYRPDPLFPDIPYRNEEEQLHDSRFMFYGVLKSFRKVLYLLTPKRERAADLIPSPFLGYLEAITNVKEMKICDPAQGSTTGFLSGYGRHVWYSCEPADKEFPYEIAEMRPLIKHVVAVEKSREETHEHLAHEGVLTAALSPESRERLMENRQHIYSVTELETYAKCPYQYFVDRVLRLRIEADETDDELSGLEKGSLLHEVLFEFYNNRRKKKAPPIGQCDAGAFKEAKMQLEALLNKKAKEKRDSRQENPIDLFWDIDIDKQRVALHKWLTAEGTNDLPPVPSYFEHNFGQSKPVCIGNVPMKGKIDRIDIGNGAFSIIDYKTGSATVRMAEILSGRSLQLPIYLQIAKDLLEKDKPGLEPAAGLYHKIRLDKCTVELGIGRESSNDVVYKSYNGEEWKPVGSRSGQLLEDENFDERLERVSNYVQQYVESISQGIFPLITRVETFVDSEEEGDAPITPSNKTAPCNYCRYKRVCRVGAISEVPQSED